MLFQISFTELYFVKKLWPDISNNDLRKIINNYKSVERKFEFSNRLYVGLILIFFLISFLI